MVARGHHLSKGRTQLRIKEVTNRQIVTESEFMSVYIFLQLTSSPGDNRGIGGWSPTNVTQCQVQSPPPRSRLSVPRPRHSAVLARVIVRKIQTQISFKEFKSQKRLMRVFCMKRLINV